MKRTLMMIRPDGKPFRDRILEKISEVADIVSTLAYNILPREIAEEFYEEHKGKFFYELLVDHHAEKPVEFLILEGDENIYQTIEDIVGDTNPTKAAPGTIRSWSNDDMVKANKEGRTPDNLVHRSRNEQDAERETQLVFGCNLYRIKNINSR